MTRRPPLAEWLLAALVAASAAHTAVRLGTDGYLPQPFVLDPDDTFMDWFNTAFWAHRPGIYDVWRSIYPPLSFVILRWAGLPGCYRESPFHARDCDWLGQAAIGVSYVLVVALLWMALRRTGRATAPPRTLAFALGLPLLFTLERGNLVLLALAAFIVAHGPVTRSPAWRALAVAATINFKPYLVVPVLARAIRREWRPLEQAALATIALYLATLAAVGSGSPGEIAANTANWLETQSAQVWGEINYATSYAPFLAVRRSGIPVLEFVPSRVIEGIERAVPAAVLATRLAALAALVAAWLQPRVLTNARIAAILIGAYLTGQSPGGYAQTFLIVLVLFEPWRGPGPIAALVCAYLLCLVADWPLAGILRVETRAWLTGRPVLADFGLTAGQFVRPGLILAIVWGLSLDGVVQVARAHRRARPSLGLAAA